MSYEFEDIEPWSEPVDGAILLDQFKQVLLRHCILPPHAAEVMALWILHTWAFETADHSAILAIVSPTKRCGKTTLFNVMSALVRRPVTASNASAAAVYRIIQLCEPTLMIDEADTFLEANETLRGILNAGNSRQGAFVLRCGGQRYDQLERFSAWSPKCIAMIGRLPDTLEDRSLVIELRRKTKDERVERFHSRTADSLMSLRQKSARWAVDLEHMRLEVDPTMPEELNDRAQDNCRHLVAIADFAGGHWPKTLREALVGLHAQSSENNLEIALLRDTQSILNDWVTNEIRSTELVTELCRWSPEWAEYRGRGLTAKGLAQLLKPFKIASYHDRRGSYYARADFLETWRRYL